jgi:predicted lipoprotein with Yx(FWY)xxD motif
MKPMVARPALRPLLIALALGLSACGSSLYGGGSSTPPASGNADAAVQTGQVGSLGTVLEDQRGYTLYLFTPEEHATVACEGSCAQAWPPLVLASGQSAASVSGQADASLLGTVALADGRSEVTYNGWPLHTFSGDSGPGQANGEGSGGMWFVVDASGTAVQSAPPPGYGYGT